MKEEVILTNEERCKVFELYGINASVNTIDGKGSIMVIYPKAIEVHMNTIGYKQEMKGRKGGGEMHYKYFFNELQLLLTPLSAISDEDAIEVAKIVHGKEMLERIEAKKHVYIYGTKKYSITPRLLRWQVREYLISRGYAVPIYIAPNHTANGKDAITLGLAIDRTTLSERVK